ncbi:hypothetical protein J6590_085294 [Homalodisca vitripennis]|nr:hypothetical protein J6590_085294 [Homalodisca vitripennis]
MKGHSRKRVKQRQKLRQFPVTKQKQDDKSNKRLAILPAVSRRRRGDFWCQLLELLRSIYTSHCFTLCNAGCRLNWSVMSTVPYHKMARDISTI